MFDVIIFSDAQGGTTALTSLIMTPRASLPNNSTSNINPTTNVLTSTNILEEKGRFPNPLVADFMSISACRFDWYIISREPRYSWSIRKILLGISLEWWKHDWVNYLKFILYKVRVVRNESFESRHSNDTLYKASGVHKRSLRVGMWGNARAMVWFCVTKDKEKKICPLCVV